MSAPREMPRRLVLGAAGGTGSETRRGSDDPALLAAGLLRMLQTPPPRLSPSARVRIVARLASTDAAAALGPPVRGRLLWSAVLAGALVLFAGGAMGAAWGLAPAQRLFDRLWRVEPGPRRAPAGTAVAVVAPPTAASATADVPALAPQVAEELAPVPPKRTVAALGHARGARASAASAPVAPGPAPLAAPAEAPQDPIVAESRLLADALTALRQRRDPRLALRSLDEYERRFPSGALAPEAAAARIDALLALGRGTQALQRLEGLSLEGLPRGTELLVLRAELRAGRGALGAALDDFTSVLSKADVPPSVVGRALYGRCSCRSRLGDVAGARADLAAYLRRFPSGPFAEPARRALRD